MEAAAMEDAVVLYPSPAIGHLISMVELAKLILKTHKPPLSINILITTPPYKAGSTTPYIHRVAAATPAITFHHLPAISLSSHSLSSTHHETLMFEVLRLNNPIIHETLISISKTHTIKALIMDFFCTPSLTVADNLNIPAFIFFTSGASVLSVFLFFQNIHYSTDKSLKDLDCDLVIPGLPPIRAKDMPKPMMDRTDKAYEYFLDYSIQLSKSAGIIINTFETLEPRALNGLSVPNGSTPPTFCIGPLIASGDDRSDGGDGSECLTWLDSQPSRTVVFLCFGSLGLFSSKQLKEIAIGLEKSGKRFLWVVRNPPDEGSGSEPDPDLTWLLPDGFFDRTRDQGLVVKQWAPQVEVLSHDSVGGFVTHCGWNSVLEAICRGVPMIAWPLYAEQRLNRTVMVKELNIAFSMNECDDDGFVTAQEIEMRVSELMNLSDDNSVRKRTMAMREEAMIALSQGGSAQGSVIKLVESW